MSSAGGAEHGLRARKRAATLAGIERAALALASELGYEQVTVEMICDAAMVSQRTFFNYFGSKEGVFLGTQPPLPSEADVAAFVAGTGTDVLGDFVELITTALVDLEPDSAVLRSRQAIIHSSPELVNRELARMGELEAQFVGIILARFAANGRTTQTTPDLADEAAMIVALAGGVIHHAMRKWCTTDLPASPHDILRESLALIRRLGRAGT